MGVGWRETGLFYGNAVIFCRKTRLGRPHALKVICKASLALFIIFLTAPQKKYLQAFVTFIGRNMNVYLIIGPLK